MVLLLNIRSIIQLSDNTTTLLNQQGLDLVLDGVNLVLDGRSIVGGDGGCDDRSGDTAGSAKRSLGWNKDVRNVFILAQERQVEQDLDWLGVCSHDDELRDTSVQRLGGLVGTLLELSQVLCLLDQVENLLAQARVCERESLWVWCGHCYSKVECFACRFLAVARLAEGRENQKEKQKKVVQNVEQE